MPNRTPDPSTSGFASSHPDPAANLRRPAEAAHPAVTGTPFPPAAAEQPPPLRVQEPPGVRKFVYDGRFACY